MMRMARRLSVAVAIALSAGTAGVALAAPLKGKTYKGAVPSTGVRTERHRTVKLHAGGSITLKVSSNGKSVTVHFSSATPVLYCNTTKLLQVQSTRPAHISSS